jgi:uncharacterized phage protein (TIGR01671 family)
MREIKFRGKILKTSEWVYGYYVYTHDRHRIIYEDYEGFYCEEEVDPETVGQYTGLKDRNGKEIYEGDIIRENYCGDIWEWVVKFSETYGGFYIHHLPTNETFYFDDMLGVFENGEVIGNIYENPELVGSEVDES